MVRLNTPERVPVDKSQLFNRHFHHILPLTKPFYTTTVKKARGTYIPLMSEFSRKMPQYQKICGILILLPIQFCEQLFYSFVFKYSSINLSNFTLISRILSALCFSVILWFKYFLLFSTLWNIIFFCTFASAENKRKSTI